MTEEVFKKVKVIIIFSDQLDTESDHPPSQLINFVNLIKEVLKKVKVIMIIGSELVKMIN